MTADNPARQTASIMVVAAVFVAGLIVLLVRLYHLQIGQAETYAAQVGEQSTRTILLPPARGLVADRWGVPLAEHRANFDIDLYLLELKSHYRKIHGGLPKTRDTYTVAGVRKTDIVDDIVKIADESLGPYRQVLGDRIQLDRDALMLHQRIREQLPFQLKGDLKFNELAVLMEKNPVVPGIRITARPLRRYSYGATASHVVGYVGRPEQALLLTRDDGGTFEAESTGKDGIELAADEYLQGDPGYRVLEVDNLGRVQRLLHEDPPRSGSTVYLTIDLRVQQIAEKAMAGVGRGACVVLDCTTGEILAMVSVPNYDPNALSDAATWGKVIHDKTRPLVNRALSSYPPGSTFKMVIALAAMTYRVVPPNYSFSCGGGLFVADRFKQCWSASGHGSVNLQEAIKISCNTYFYNLGVKTGIDRVFAVGNAIGLGDKNDIPLPRVSAGTLPSRDWMRATYPRDRWSDGHMANAAIGQGYVLVTPLQMAMVAAAIANKGAIYKPQLIQRIIRPDGEAEFEFKPELRGQLNIESKAMEVIRRGMWEVVNEPGGTGKRAAVPGIAVAGKTGTAQFKGQVGGEFRTDNKTWFISFAPFEQPRYAACVMVEGGTAGGVDCAPRVREIFYRMFRLIRQNENYELAYTQPQAGHFGGSTAFPDEPTAAPSELTAENVPVTFEGDEERAIPREEERMTFPDRSSVQRRAKPYRDQRPRRFFWRSR